jgi:cell cycle arrest protein BUB3
MDENLIISGSWDKSVHYTDHRSNKLVQKVSLPGKVFAMDTTDQFIVVGMSERQVHVYDSRNLSVPFQVRESGLRYQTRDLKCMPNGEGYAQSSIEGRVAVEYFDPDPQVQSKKYAFKCHRLVASDADLVSPVNALTFHTKYGTLFTAGSDCHVCLWDHVSKKRLRQYSKFDQSVVSMDFGHKSGLNMLAIATSDDSYKTFATSDIQPEPVQSHLYLRLLGDSEGIPKSIKST